MKKIGFNSKKYCELTQKEIKKRIKKFNNKLYLEIGGKLFDDYHASRILPGFKYDSKIETLKSLKDITEVIVCISAKDIDRNKVRADYGITYDNDVKRLIDKIASYGFKLSGVVITLYDGQKSADKFKQELELDGIKVYTHYFTQGYPSDVDLIVSDEGYGANEFIKTTKPLVIVTAPGPGSGKLATCLSQLYHEYKNGNNAGYAKFETFPVWNLPLKHPVNVAYEAATADLKDVNMIDPFHLEKYKKATVNYNRDIETFPIVKKIFQKITNEDIYYSPTDMGINMIGDSITDDEVVREAACKEIIRRYYKSLVEYRKGQISEESSQRIKVLMNELEIDTTKRKVVASALKKKEQKGTNAMAIELPNGKIITGRITDIMSAPAACVLNALKHLCKLKEDVPLLSHNTIEPMLQIKREIYGEKETLNLQEILLALSICSATNPIINKILSQLPKLKKCEAHSTYILSETDSKVLKRLEINYTCEAEYNNKELYNE